MLCRLAALSLVAIISPGCTTYITQVQAQESGEDDAASSFPASSYPDAEDSTTGGEGESSSTGGDASSTDEPDAGSTTLAMDSSSTSGTSGDAPIETTSDASTSGDASSTTGEPIDGPLLPSGADCDSGSQCETGLCFGHPNNGEGSPGHCSLQCDPNLPNNCDGYYPDGACVFGGVDIYYCADAPAVEPAPLSAHGALCIEDGECKSGLCLDDTIGEEPGLRRCAVACSVDTATSCASAGHPGLCLSTGGEHHCIGSFPNTDLKTMAAPLPGDNVTQETIVMVAPKAVAFILIPASGTDLYLESSAFKGNGNGAPVYDLLSDTGAVLSTHEWTSNNGTFQYAHIPIKAQGSYWLRVRREEPVQQVYSQHYLKHPYWPNDKP